MGIVMFMDGSVDSFTDSLMAGLIFMDRSIDRFADSFMNGLTDGFMDGRVSSCMDSSAHYVTTAPWTASCHHCFTGLRGFRDKLMNNFMDSLVPPLLHDGTASGSEALH